MFIIFIYFKFPVKIGFYYSFVRVVKKNLLKTKEILY